MELSKNKSYYFTYKGRDYMVTKHESWEGNLYYTYYTKPHGIEHMYGPHKYWYPYSNYSFWHKNYGKRIKCKSKGLKLFHDAAEAMSVIKHGTRPNILSQILGFKVREDSHPFLVAVPPFKVKYGK
jgi:hypothetical protein